MRLAAARRDTGDRHVPGAAAGMADEKESFVYDKVIFVGGQNHLQDLEGHDRPDMKLPYAQDVLIEELLQVRPDAVIVLMSGSPVEMPWLQSADTLVWQWYAGMEGGTALAETLFGIVHGKEVVQLYIGKEDSKKERPARELRAFEKVELAAGESRRVTFQLDREAFAYYEESKGSFCVEPGEYKISVGKSVEDICVYASYFLNTLTSGKEIQ